MKYWLPAILLALGSCRSSSESTILKMLKDLHGEEFRILDSRHIIGTGEDRYTASPLQRPEITFTVDYKPDTESITSYYAESLWAHEAQPLVESRLRNAYSRFASFAVVHVDREIDPRKIPPLSRVIESNPNQVSLVVHLYLFQDLDDPVLKGLREFARWGVEGGLKSTKILVKFFDEARFAEVSLPSLSFGFNVVGETSFESSEECRKHFRGTIRFGVDRDSEVPSIDTLRELRSDSFTSMKIHKL